MENENKKDTPKLTEAPERLAKASIIAYLRERGAGGIMDAFALSTVLGTITRRTVRYYTTKGELKSCNPGKRGHIYTIEAVADFLLKHPKFAVQKKQGWTVDESTVPIIKECIHSDWKAMLKHFSEDELVSEVLTKLMTQRQSESVKTDIRIVIRRRLCDIWRKLRRDAMGHVTGEYNDNITKGGKDNDD